MGQYSQQMTYNDQHMTLGQLFNYVCMLIAHEDRHMNENFMMMYQI